MPNIFSPNDSFFSQLERYNYEQETLKKAQRHNAENVINQLLTQNVYELASMQPFQLSAVIDSTLWRYCKDLGDVAQNFCSGTKLDWEGVYIAILSFISASTWGRVCVNNNPISYRGEQSIDPNGWFEPAIDMVLQFAPSGAGKTTVFKRLIEPFNEFQQSKNRQMSAIRNDHIKKSTAVETIRKAELNDLIKRARAKKGASLQDKFATIAQELAKYDAESKKFIGESEMLNEVQIFISKGSLFRLVKLLSQQGETIAVLSDEGDILNSTLLGKDGDTSLFLDAHTQSPYSTTAANSNNVISIEKPSIPMMIFTQEPIAKKFYCNKNTEKRGITERFIPFLHQYKYRFNECNAQNSYLDSSCRQYSRVITRLLNIYYTQDKNKRFIVGLDASASQSINRFKDDMNQYLKGNENEPWYSCLCKACGQALRFAWDIHAWNQAVQGKIPHETKISDEDMQCAISLMYFLIPYIRYVYEPIGLEAYINAYKILESYNNDNISTIVIQAPNLYNQYNTINTITTTSTVIQQRTGLKYQAMDNALVVLQNHNLVRYLKNGDAKTQVIFHPNFRSYIK